MQKMAAEAASGRLGSPRGPQESDLDILSACCPLSSAAFQQNCIGLSWLLHWAQHLEPLGCMCCSLLLLRETC